MSSVKGQDPLSNRACRFPAHGLPMVFVTQHARLGQRRARTHRGRHAADATSRPEAAWHTSLARAEVVVRCDAQMRVGVIGTGPAGHALTLTLIPSATKAEALPSDRVVRRDRSPVLRPPRTPAAHDSISPSAYTSRAAPTRAAQTGLSCSAPLRARVLRPLPRRDLRRVHLRTEASQTWPSPRNDRLGSRVVNLSRLQASRHVAARVLASSVEACDTPLGPPRLSREPGVCYSALRRLPRRDLHPLETNSVKQTFVASHRHDAPFL